MFTNYARKHSLETDTNNCFQGRELVWKKAAEDLVCTFTYNPVPFESCHMHYYMRDYLLKKKKKKKVNKTIYCC